MREQKYRVDINTNGFYTRRIWRSNSLLEVSKLILIFNVIKYWIISNKSCQMNHLLLEIKNSLRLNQIAHTCFLAYSTSNVCNFVYENKPNDCLMQSWNSCADISLKLMCSRESPTSPLWYFMHFGSCFNRLHAFSDHLMQTSNLTFADINGTWIICSILSRGRLRNSSDP